MSNKLSQEAKGRQCQIAILGVCNGNPETTVLAHLNNKRLFRCGMGMKVPDWAGAWACSDCHDCVDFRTKHPSLTNAEIKLAHMEGVVRTMRILIEEGKIISNS